MKPAISILTLYNGRPLYLKRNLLSVKQAVCETDANIEHKVFCQGAALDDSIKDIQKSVEGEFSNYSLEIIQWDKNYGTGEGLNRALPTLSGNLVFKFDEDAEIVSRNFFNHVLEINNILENNCSFSPYPVGLIGNPGGVHSTTRFVRYSQQLDTFYTFRAVAHIGGFARITPKHIMSAITFPYDYSIYDTGNEDSVVSHFCRTHYIMQLYLENAIVVEHQESTLGQHERYAEYFKDRRK